jgi:hypothetical protein
VAPRLLAVSSRAISVQPLAHPADETPAYFVMCGKDLGAGTSVVLTSVNLPGLGVKLGRHVADPFVSLPKDAAPTPLAQCVAHVTGLVPNEAYVFASAAFTSAGDVIGGISATCAPVVAASPLPLPLLWAQLAATAARCGEMGLARRAAARVVALWVSFGPIRPPSLRSPFVALSMRESEIARTPRPFLYALVRCLHIVGVTGEGGAGAPATNASAVHLLSSSGDASAPRGSSGVGNAAVDAQEEGRAWEGPWSSSERAIVASLSGPVKADAAMLRQIATFTLAVQAATVLR